jgi:hypothetical protein
MDDMATNNKNPYAKSEEEMAWDAEFANMKEPSNNGNVRYVTSMVGDLAKLAVQVPVALIQMPMALLPEETARHARAALRESFLAVRSLIGAVGDGIENLLTEPSERTTTVSGPPGTWGSGRQPSYGTGNTPPGKARRIEVSDEVPERSGTPITIEGEDSALAEDRGLRADIEY